MIYKKKNIFIIGNKGLSADYDGFERFIKNLAQKQVTQDIQYYVFCLDSKNFEENHNNINWIHINVPNIGWMKNIYYDIMALKYILNDIDSHYFKRDGLVYILGCRIGPWIKKYIKEFHKRNYKIIINSNRETYSKAKYNALTKKYLKFSQKVMIKNADLLICDSQQILDDVKKEFNKSNLNAVYLPYGTAIENEDHIEIYEEWKEKHRIIDHKYYLVIGKLSPENNYEILIKEFMKSNTKKDLIIIADKNNKFYKKLKSKLKFDEDKRIKFVGTIQDNKLLNTIRKNAFAYIYGQKDIGSNLSLLESMSMTKLNLLYNSVFNQEVGLDSCIYWGKENNNLKHVIEHVETFDQNYIDELGKIAYQKIEKDYNLEDIIKRYEELFLNL